VFLIFLFNSLITPNLIHPISLGIILFIQTIITCSITRLLLSSCWISSTIFLVIIGGLIILFIYITSICSNKKFLFKKLNLTQIVILIFITLIIFIYQHPISITIETFNLKDLPNLEFLKLFLPINILSSNFMFIYILIILIIIISILPLTKGPLRKKY